MTEIPLKLKSDQNYFRKLNINKNTPPKPKKMTEIPYKPTN